MPKKSIDIVLPAYNPHLNWEKGVVENFKELCLMFPSYDFSLFIATDGSVRGFESSVVEYLKAKVENVAIVDHDVNMGKGFALRSAVSQCKGDWVIYIDYDFPYTFESIAKVIESLNDGADVVIAARADSYQKNLPLMRKILSYASHAVNKSLFNLPFKDTQGGMKGFNKKGKGIFLQTKINTFLFDTEFIYKAVKTGADVRTVDAEIKKGLKVSVMGMKVLFRELENLPKVRS